MDGRCFAGWAVDGQTVGRNSLDGEQMGGEWAIR